MDTSQQKSLMEKLSQAKKIEVFFTPDRGLDVDVEGETILSTKEFHLVVTDEGHSSLKIRCHQKYGNIDDWHDILIPDVSVFSVITREV